MPSYLNANISAADVPESNTLATCKGTYELLATFFNTTAFSLAAGITVKSPAVPTNKLKPSFPCLLFTLPPLPLYNSKAAPPPVNPGADKVKVSSPVTSIT